MTDIDKVICGDCLEVMKEFPDNSFDAVVTDPPYELGFMGKSWDKSGIANSVEMWAEVFRVMKPGAHLLSFGGTRTHHRMTCAIEDAGFEIRDCLMWVYGSGFPKSLDISKAIDGRIGKQSHGFNNAGGKENFQDQDLSFRSDYGYKYVPTKKEALYWQGWGTALKPAYEPIILARKPLSEPTVAANVLKWGTGGVNVDGCRIDTHGKKWASPRGGIWKTDSLATADFIDNPQGRWPANILFDEEAAAMLDEQSGESKSTARPNCDGKIYKTNTYGNGRCNMGNVPVDSGGASRFFYCAKASRRERNEGCEGMEEGERVFMGSGGRTQIDGEWIETHSEPKKRVNHHPTVKPLALIRYLCRLITPPGGIILDPFIGSGTLGRAAREEGFHFVGIEREPEYCAIAERRIKAARENHQLELAAATP